MSNHQGESAETPAPRRPSEPDRGESGPGDAGPPRRGEEPERASSAGRSSTERTTAKGEPKDVGFGASHGYKGGHGGPTSPGDAPAKGAPLGDEGALDRAAKRGDDDPRPDE